MDLIIIIISFQWSDKPLIKNPPYFGNNSMELISSLWSENPKGFII